MCSRSATFLGDQKLTDVEVQVLSVYNTLKELLRQEDLSPCVEMSLRQALAAMFPAVNALGLEYEFLYEFGV